MSAIALFALLGHAATASAYYTFDAIYAPTSPYPLADIIDMQNAIAAHALGAADWVAKPATPSVTRSWRCDTTTCTLSVPVLHLEADSLRLNLAADGKTLALSGERKIEGCKCTPSEDMTINLPFTPRVEDIQSSMNEFGRLLITLPKHTAVAEPIAIQITKPAPTPKQLHFVPHESATTSPSTAEEKLEEKERTLTEKFRAAGLAVRIANQATQANQETSEASEPAVVNEAATNPGTAASEQADGPVPA